MRLTITGLFLAALATAYGQSTSQDPGSLKFEVASIKTSPPDARGGMARPDPGGLRYRGSNLTLRLYLAACYRIRNDQIVGAPGWLDSDRFDIVANAPKQSSVEQMYLMLRNLLIERCHLQFHLENREMPIYALSVDPAGAKLTRHDAGNGGEPWIEQASEAPFHAKWTATSASMDIFAGRLARVLDRPVIDQTGLQGDYDFTLRYTLELPPNVSPDALVKNGQPIDTSGPNVFLAVRQQLGLRLDARKGRRRLWSSNTSKSQARIRLTGHCAPGL
jgi:uncharacterized protein (TIGR03435 family)